ncbi:MAG: YkgJ family cysteine cluster protein [Marinilabiliales bacterium]|nr:YkgJ family cysteine cluster protein [Marinilabiliales bacterium]
MSYKRIIAEVMQLYHELDEHLALQASHSGMTCPNSCDLCCRKTDIAASPLEFLPLAASLYETGQLTAFMERLEDPSFKWCVCFDPEAAVEGRWSCRHYPFRALICRLFGYGYRLDKEGNLVLVTCRLMKEEQPEAVGKAMQRAIDQPEEMPVFSHYSLRLMAIDPDLAVPQMPINQAARLAIEKLYFHYLGETDETGRSEESLPQQD